jgi:hypothetical protein
MWRGSGRFDPSYLTHGRFCHIANLGWRIESGEFHSNRKNIILIEELSIEFLSTGEADLGIHPAN